MTEGKGCCPTTNTEECSTKKKCCPKKLIMASFIAFVVTFLYDGYVHGSLLMDQYIATASMWRPESDIKAMFNYCIGKHALEAIVFAMLFVRWKCTQTFGALFSCSCPVRKGFCYGATIGLLLGISQASAYIYMPIPKDLAASWLIAETVKWGLAGALLSFLCSRCKKA